MRMCKAMLYIVIYESVRVGADFWYVYHGHQSREHDATYSPPNSCMPSRAKMRMKRNSRNSSEMMDLMLLSSEMTRLRRDAQYLETTHSASLQLDHPRHSKRFIHYNYTPEIQIRGGEALTNLLSLSCLYYPLLSKI